jgi:hypothetical protein
VIVTAYPVPHKQKSADICLAFARGCNGQIAYKLRSEGGSFFYGVTAGNLEAWQGSQDGRTIFYSDGSLFDSAREAYFRVAKNMLQPIAEGASDGTRFAALGIEIKPWRSSGSHIVVCPQSAHFMKTLAGVEFDWTEQTLQRLKTVTDREIRVRPWSANKSKSSATLAADLVGAHALVTWSSAAAVTALLAGIPVVVESDDCSARPMSGTLEQIENLPTPDGRHEWANQLADQQWSLDEFRSGFAWSALSSDE